VSFDNRSPVGRRTGLALAFGAVLGLAVYNVPAFGQGSIFKWTDSAGIVHFSDSNVPREYAGKVEERQHRHIRVATGQPETEGTSIPLLAQDGRKYVNATLEGPNHSRQIMMLVDTGAQMSMIDEDLADDLGLEFVTEAGIIGVTGTSPGWVGRVQRLKLEGKELSDWPILVGPSQGLALLGTDVLDHLELSVGSKSLEGK
jgi:predicted aspartyl protease